MFALLCIALFAGALAEISLVDGDINYEWQEVTPMTARRVPIVDGLFGHPGFSFRINTEISNSNDSVRTLEFAGAAYEYLGYITWSDSSMTVYGEKHMCANMEYVDSFPSGTMDGSWYFMFDSDKISLSYENEEWATYAMVDNPGDIKMAGTLGVEACGWMPDAKYLIMKAFSDGTKDENDYYKYTNDANDAPSADMCMRGEFFWQEKCNKCPPGKSTVQEGNTTYNDCVDMRYIQCSPEEDKLECEMNICPCGNYEECDRDMNSASYGMCKQKSDYINRNSARGVAVTTALVAMAFFAL